MINKKNQMKIRKLLIVFLIINLVSCERILQKEDNKYEVIDTNEDVIDLLAGSYYWLLQLHDEKYFEYTIRGDDINYIASSISATSEGNRVRRCSWSTNPPRYHITLDRPYKVLYKAIMNLNRIIESFKNNEMIDGDPELLGEAYLLRAYCYFKLTRFFGEIPVIDNTKVNYEVPLSSIDEVYNFIEQNMFNAIELLPETYSYCRIPGVTPNQGTAKAILAEIYLTMGGYPLNNTEMYGLAAQYAGEVIENADQYHFALLDDFAELWTEDNRINNENIFGLFCSDETKTNEGLLLSNHIDPLSSISMSMVDQDFNDYLVFSYIMPEIAYFNNFPLNYRKRVTFHMGDYYVQSVIVDDYDYSWFEWFELDSAWNHCELKDYVYCQKWLDIHRINGGFGPSYEIMMEDSSITNKRYSSQTIYIYRFAHTLLTYAEAKARSGQLDASAYEAVNKVRRRAYKLDINTPSKYDLQNLTNEQFADSVVLERAWEFFYEPEGRWFDMIRLDLKDKAESWRDSWEPEVYLSSAFDNNSYFAHLPQEDIWLNPNLETNDDK